MKKTIAMILLACLFCLSATAEPAPTPNFAPDIAPAPGVVEAPSGNDGVQDTTEPEAPAEQAYATLTNETYSMKMEYPEGWSQIPGRYTLCFVENVAEGQTPGRIAVTRKKVSKTPDEDAITKQLISYLKALQTQYDTYDVGDLSTDTVFVGQTGYSTEYIGKKGDTSVKGYVIMAAIERYLYVYHFSSAETAFEGYEEVRNHLRDAIVVNLEE